MNKWAAIKLYGLLGLMVSGGCATSRNATGRDDPKILSTDTTRVAHVRYTPERDYINLELIQNGQPTEQYTEIIAFPESDTTFFGDTILIQHKKNTQNIINISAQRRTHQK